LPLSTELLRRGLIGNSDNGESTPGGRKLV
jgi:hypothetical protein